MGMSTKPWISSTRRILRIGAAGCLLIAAVILFAAARDGLFSTPLDLLASQTASEALLATMPGDLEYDTVTAQATHTEQPGLALPIAAVDATLYVLGAAILWLLAMVFREAEDGRPFTPASVGRIRTAAWLTVAIAVIAFYAKPFVMAWTSSQFGDGSWSVQATFLPFLIAIAAFGVAAIWQRGAELADLDEHTI